MAPQDPQETQNESSSRNERNVPHEDGNRWLKIVVVCVCIVDLTYIVATAVLIGMLKGWGYSVHCFLLCVLVLVNFVLTVKAKTRLEIKNACWRSCTTLVLVLMTTFTLLTRQAYYHPSPDIEPKWILFCLHASIIPLILGVLVIYEGSIQRLYEDRFILMIAILDFADIWDMASILAQHKAPYLKEESPLEITVQVFCSFSFPIFSVLILKNITQEIVNLPSENSNHPSSEQERVDPALFQKYLNDFCLRYAQAISQLNQNIPFLIIRILILVNHGYVDFDYLAKNVITVILYFIDCCSCQREPPNP